jgi:hypothetical protein
MHQKYEAEQDRILENEPDQSTANRSPAVSVAAPRCRAHTPDCTSKFKASTPLISAARFPGLIVSSRRSRFGVKNCAKECEADTRRTEFPRVLTCKVHSLVASGSDFTTPCRNFSSCPRRRDTRSGDARNIVLEGMSSTEYSGQWLMSCSVVTSSRTTTTADKVRLYGIHCECENVTLRCNVEKSRYRRRTTHVKSPTVVQTACESNQRGSRESIYYLVELHYIINHARFFSRGEFIHQHCLWNRHQCTENTA